MAVIPTISQIFLIEHWPTVKLDILSQIRAGNKGKQNFIIIVVIWKIHLQRLFSMIVNDSISILTDVPEIIAIIWLVLKYIQQFYDHGAFLNALCFLYWNQSQVLYTRNSIFPAGPAL